MTLGFLACYIGLLFARTLWLGDPLSIPLHQLETGALLIFAFFMISDPKTTPDSRTGRLAFALLVALAALYVQFGLFRPNGPLWALIACSPLVPLVDRFFPGARYDWSRPSTGHVSTSLGVPAHSPAREVVMAHTLVVASICITGLMLWSGSAFAFCGFFVWRRPTPSCSTRPPRS